MKQTTKVPRFYLCCFSGVEVQNEWYEPSPRNLCPATTSRQLLLIYLEKKKIVQIGTLLGLAYFKIHAKYIDVLIIGHVLTN